MSRKYNLDLDRLREQEVRGRNIPSSIPTNKPSSPYTAEEGRPSYRPQSQSQTSQSTSRTNRPFSSNQNKNRLKEIMQSLPLIAINIASFFGSLFKASLIVLGVMAINIADSAMGTLGLSFIFNNKISEYTVLSDVTLGLVFSLGLSAVQIYMWMLIQKRGISLRHLWQWKRVPADVKNFLMVAMSLWVIDTFIDTSPLAVVMTNENFIASPLLYQFLSASVYIVTIVLCGFAELITSNMKEMFEGEK